MNAYRNLVLQDWIRIIISVDGHHAEPVNPMNEHEIRQTLVYRSFRIIRNTIQIRYHSDEC